MGLFGDLINSIFHPQEIQAMFKVKYGGLVQKERSEPLTELAQTLPDLEFCYEVLNKVSRSFAVVIQQLPERLKDPVCIFYLVLRGLDSVEDDMTFPLKDKLPLLRTFHKKLEEDGWRIKGVGDTDDYRTLLANFDKVIRMYQALELHYKKPIKDICKRMGYGMAEFAEKKVTTVEGYNLYCHYVAGLVGWGLSDLFSASGLEDPTLKDQHRISNSMGLFLQKTNIIRDYLEDLEGGRTFWPDEIWRLYGDKLSSFKENPKSERSLAALNHMVTDALQHVPDCLEYLGRIRNPCVFRFCAIPQVMAIATLAAVYNNPNVFRSVVKIRKGLSCDLMVNTNDMASVRDTFRYFISSIFKRTPLKDPSAAKTYELIEQIRSLVQVPLNKGLLRFSSLIAWIVFLTVTVYLLGRYHDRHLNGQPTGGALESLSSSDFFAVIAMFASITYIFGFFGIQYV